MSNILKYNGYVGSVEVSIEDNCLHGKLLFIKDVVTYEAQSPGDLEKEFQAAIADYVETCKELGIEPRKPCSGTFNVRIGPVMHEQAVVAATMDGLYLNDFVTTAISDKLDRVNSTEIHHHHYPVKEYISNFEIDTTQNMRMVNDVDYIGQLHHVRSETSHH